MTAAAVRGHLAPAIAAVAVVGYAIMGQSTYWTGLLTLTGIYAIAAIGLNLLFGGAGQISLGHAGFIGMGAWATAVITAQHGLPWLLAAGASIVAAVGVGLLLGYAALRIAGHYLALATVAFGLLFAEVMSIRLPSGLYGIPPVDLFGWQAGSQRALLLVVWTVVAVVYAFVRSLQTSRFGRALAALRDDPLAAAAAGVDVARAKIVTFAISAALGGLSGALFAPYQASVTDVSFGFTLSIILLHMIVVGGLGSPGGAVIGALFLVIVPELGRDYERYRLLAYGVVLVMAVVLFPRGLAGWGRDLADRWWPPSSPRPATSPVEDRAVDHGPSGGPYVTGPPARLEALDLTRTFGGLAALVDVDLAVAPGELAVVIGPNGAGKTTLFNCLSGVLAPDRGTVRIGGRDLTGRPAHEFAAAGVARTFQHARTFSGLDVIGNVLVGAHLQLTAGWLRGALRPPSVRAEERAVRDQAMALLTRLDLDHRADDPVGDLTLHEERRLELARCLIAEPTVLLLDEPFAGLGDAEARQLAAEVDRVRTERALAVVLIEHHVDLALELADHVTVLDFGRVIAHGPADQVRTDPAVVAAYMGVA